MSGMRVADEGHMAHLSNLRKDGYLSISDYALIGNCHTAALVGMDGSIDWYCPGEFDASAVFCRILDDTKGGFLSIVPAEHCDVERQYVPETAVLQTTF